MVKHLKIFLMTFFDNFIKVLPHPSYALYAPSTDFWFDHDNFLLQGEHSQTKKLKTDFQMFSGENPDFFLNVESKILIF